MNTTLTKTTAIVSTDMLANAQENNNIFASVGVTLPFRNHYVNMATGDVGIEKLIISILENNMAIFPAGVESTPMRNIAIASAMYISDIIANVRFQFGADRYPDATIYSYVSVFMMKQKKVGKINLSNVEDKNRECCRPRGKFYLIQKTP